MRDPFPVSRQSSGFSPTDQRRRRSLRLAAWNGYSQSLFSFARRTSPLHLHIHQLCCRHHVVVQICHDQKRSDDDQDNDQYTKR